VTEPPVSGLAVLPVEADSGRTAWPERAAALIRAAYAGSDPLPGLPAPDGARETAAAVREFLDGGGSLWTARTRHGGLAGVLRTARTPDGAWVVSRVAVAPGWRGRGVSRLLLAAVEEAAVVQAATDGTAGGIVVRLDAVVERCLPSLYARLGYRAVRHWAAADKPLTELTLERDPATPRRPTDLHRFWDGDTGAITGAVCWFTGPHGLSALARPAAAGLAEAIRDCCAALPDPGSARLAGVDVWGAEPGDLERVHPFAGLRYRAARHDVPHHMMPRTRHPDLWAALRFPPGAEPDPRTLLDDARPLTRAEAP
jgi:GNAT superfamily N-acetyltransferase